jgi:hypothetical protein
MKSTSTRSNTTPQKKCSAAKLTVKASVVSAAASEAFAKDVFPGFDVHELIEELEKKIQRIKSGDMGSIEEMLIGQSHTLQTIFICLARRASIEKNSQNFQTFMNLALRAQNQSRSTLQALVDVKSPKQVAFFGQANIAQGHMLVKNNLTKLKQDKFEKYNLTNELLVSGYGS